MKILRIKQSLGAVIITWLEIALAAACIVFFFFPMFTLVDIDMFPMVTLSQFRMLFGGSFECGQISSQTVEASGNPSFLIGFLVPMFMILILYFRRLIRPFFAYLFHALISIALLFYMFTTCSVAGGIARENSDIINTYQLTTYWYILIITVFVGLLLSILLIVFDIYRLKNRQKNFEKQEAEMENSEEAEVETDEPENSFRTRTNSKAEKFEEVLPEKEEAEEKEETEEYEVDEKEQKKEKTSTDDFVVDDINRSVKDAISTDKKSEPEPVAHISTEISHDELARQAKREAAASESEQKTEDEAPAEKRAVKVKAKIKPAQSSQKSSSYPRTVTKHRSSYPQTNTSYRRTPSAPRVRTLEDDFDVNSGY